MLLNNPVHIGIICADMDESIKKFQTRYGIGPFEDFGELHENAIRFGKEHILNYKAAMAPFGNINLELIQPTGGDSVFEDALKTQGECIHHTCIAVDDVLKAKTQAIEEGFEILDEVPMYEMQPGFSLGFFFMKSKDSPIVFEVVEERHY